MACKVYVGVTVKFDSEGLMHPVALTWEDGRDFDIDRVTEVRRAVSTKAGGSGMRYTCLIRKKTVFLFYEEPRWFMEGKSEVDGNPPPKPPPGTLFAE
jgi:hypothetical protein